MIRRLFGSCASALALLLFAAPALATSSPPVSVQLVGLTKPAKQGVSYPFDVVLTAATTMTLSQFSITGTDSLDSVAHNAPQFPVLLSGRSNTRVIRVTLTAATSDPGIRISFRANSTVVTRTYDFTADGWQLATGAGGSSLVPEGVFIPEPLSILPSEGVLQSVPREERIDTPREKREALKSQSKTTGGRNILVKGRFVYLRSDGQTLPVDNTTVRVYDEDWDWDEHLGSATTGVDGRFEVTVYASEDEPDLYLEFELANTRVVVEHGMLEFNYLFTTGVKDDFTGSTADFGTRQPTTEVGRAACHIFNNVVRSWREIYAMGRDVPSVDVVYPSSDWPNYDGEINIPIQTGSRKWGWESGMHVHEYGHHIQRSFFYVPDHDYDNGICDNPNGDPGHCAWCEEDDGTAIKEGFANWVADIVGRRHVQAYGQAMINGRETEFTGSCGEGSIYGDQPSIIEGYFAALLRDLEDGGSDNEDDPNERGIDMLSISPSEILSTMADGNHEGPNGFINKFLTRNPNLNRQSVWNTFVNAGYDLDSAPPGISPYFESTSHNEGLQHDAVPDRTIDMTWQAAGDDYSGAVAYSLAIGTSPTLPNETIEVNAIDGLAYTLQAPGPGNYYITLRARDDDGNWSIGYAQAGPYRIRDPYPADLAAASPLPSGWDAAVTVRGNTTATNTWAAASGFLNGGGSVYWNTVAKNYGEIATSSNRVRLLVDGVQRDSIMGAAAAGGATSFMINRGPIVVGGGRHTVEAWYDGAEWEAETNEDNNHRSRQLVWDADPLNAYTFYTNPAPPKRSAGHADLLSGVIPFDNCDGFEISHVYTPPGGTIAGTALWSGVYAHSGTGPLVDVDLKVFDTSTGSTNGFAIARSSSSRTSGLLDAVFTNRVPNGDNTWDVGVYRDGVFSLPYQLKQMIPATIRPGDSLTVSFAQDEMMKLYVFTPSAAQTGWYSVDVRGAPAIVNNVTSLWFDYARETAGIEDFDRKATSNLSGRSTLSVTAFDVGTYLLAVHRNPSIAQGPMSFGLKLSLAQADVRPFDSSGWAAPLVPRRTADAAPGPAVPTATLNGDGTTYMNVSARNDGSVLAGLVKSDLFWDGVRNTGPQFITFSGGTTRTAYDISPTTIPGGRHTLWMELDPDDWVVESDETDNISGQQWVFTPPVRPLNTPRWRKNGKAVDAGWSTLPAGEIVQFNQDGIRTPDFTSGLGHKWGGVALMPLGASDMDLWLHEKAPGSTSGFDSPLTTSDWGAGVLDYVLVDFGTTGYRGFDAGLLRVDVPGIKDTAQYVTEVLGAQTRANPLSVIGPVTIGYGELMDLYTLPLTFGKWNIRVVNGFGSNVDWGVALHQPGTPFQNRTDGRTRASWLGGSGVNEFISVNVDQPGDYCLVVFKAGERDIIKSGSYTVQITLSTVDVDTDGPPLTTGLRSAAPDPFVNDVRFGLDLAEASNLRLDIHDVTGARRRVLAEGPWSAGRHSLVWDGRDEGGRSVPPGLYLVRMVAGGKVSTRKVVRTK